MSNDFSASTEWLSATRAARLLGIDRKALRRLADRRLVRTRKLPTIWRQYDANDVLRLRDVSVNGAPNA